MTIDKKTSNPLLQKIEQCSSNPLREGIGPARSPRDLMLALSNRPITPENVAEVPLGQRELVISEYKEIFVPTTQTLEIAIAMQGMLLEGLDRRDPRLQENRLFITESAEFKGQRFDQIPSFPRAEAPALGMLIEGITGSGKSVVTERILKLYPQVIDHGPNLSCGWMALKQLVSLRVHMPSDGSRGGFLAGAFLELDKALGTTYSEQYKGWTVEKQLVMFLHLLTLHRCGLLVIEEAQAKALSVAAPYGREFLTFFLRLLNFGIPTVLIGNPLAFVLLNQFSQDGCRFSESGSFRLEPEMDPQSHDWSTLWIRHLWSPTLLDEPDAPYQPFSEHPLDQTLEGFVWRRTAGFPRFVSRLRREVQARALSQGLRRVTPELVDDTFRTSPKFTKIRGLIDAFVHKDWRTLSTYVDIPGGDYKAMWEQSAPENPSSESPPLHNASPAPAPVVAKRSEPRRKSTTASRKSTLNLSPEDIRSAEFQKTLCEQMKAHILTE